MKKILITGGAGFIGSNLGRKLISDKYFVVAVDNLSTSDGLAIKELKKEKNFKFIKHDISKPLPKELRNTKFEAIFHLACPTGVDNLLRLGEEMLLACSKGTWNVAELAREQKSQVIFTSSSEVYGNPEVFPQKETYEGKVDSTGYRSTYEEGKRVSESILFLFFRKYGVDIRIARVFNTYGPFMTKSDSRAIPRFLGSALKNKNLSVEGKGIQQRTFCYVDDLVEGLIAIWKKGKKGEVYNLGSDKELRIVDLAGKIISLTNSKSKIRFIDRPNHDHDRRLPDLSKIKKLGWRANISIEEGLRRTIEWYGY
jgi:nucleoside-diphosphate-sugar epimerase